MDHTAIDGPPDTVRAATANTGRRTSGKGELELLEGWARVQRAGREGRGRASDID